MKNSKNLKLIAVTSALPMFLLANSCSPSNVQLVVDGVLSPTEGTSGCLYQTSTGPYLSGGLFPIGAQEGDALNAGVNADLHYIIGLNVDNNLNSAPLLDANGNVVSTKARDDVFVSEIDVSFTVDPGSPVGSLPSETFETGQEVPGGGSSPIIFDIVGTPLAEALPKSGNNFRMYASITLKGQTATQSALQSDPYVFAIDVTYGTVNPSCTVVGSNCPGQVQDDLTTNCTDGGT